MRKEMFDELLESVREMKAIQSGRRRPARVTRTADLVSGDSPDVGALRAAFKLSQPEFAALLGISVDTLQNWEQGRRRPHGPARVLLRIAAEHPDAILSVTRRPKRHRSTRTAV